MEIPSQPAAMLIGASTVGGGVALATTPAKWKIPAALIGMGAGAIAGAAWDGGARSENGIASNANDFSDPKAYVPLFAGATLASGIGMSFAVSEGLSAGRTIGIGVAGAVLGGMLLAGAIATAD